MLKKALKLTVNALIPLKKVILVPMRNRCLYNPIEISWLLHVNNSIDAFKHLEHKNAVVKQSTDTTVEFKTIARYKVSSD